MSDTASTARVKQERSSWEQEYSSGKWSCLGASAEFAHYAIVAAYIQILRRPISLLDIGCGEGQILKHLNLDLIAQYTGVDIAQAALDQITPKRPQDRYICSTLENFRPDAKWDVILFNEVLYYTFDPVANIKPFEAALTAEGRMLVSIYKKKNPFAWNNRCLRKVQRYFREAGYTVEDAVEISRIDTRVTWQVFQVKPPRR